MATATMGWVVPFLLQSEVVDPSCPCSKAKLNALDRPFAGTRNAGASTVSDISIGLIYALVVGLDAVEIARAHGDIPGYLEDLVVFAETVVLNGALTQLSKVLVARPRPLVYGLASDAPELRDAENFVSFYSAHTANAFSLGIAFAQTFARRHSSTLARALVYGAAILAAGTIGTLRVLSGKHFPSDVLTGAVVGSGIGLLVPLLHARDASTQLTFLTGPGGATLQLSMVVP